MDSVLTMPSPTVEITRTVIPDNYEESNPIYRFTVGNVLALLPRNLDALESETVLSTVRRHQVRFTVIPGKFYLWLDYTHRNERLLAEFFGGVVQLTQTHATWHGSSGSSFTKRELLTPAQQALRNDLLCACVSKAGLR